VTRLRVRPLTGTLGAELERLPLERLEDESLALHE